ncbi:aminomethyl-transferring glycine dehydrogenase subunit GcvPA [Legionella sp. W05-934-2]|jgi:glycine dehydrogenase subunit 1|uniref:aminomethyl-transferring glycine dehydrogenase subunit GcvPA n=1 Tax=Legionella sp. W05-934-2 TaxID=1198649 RepID=UPI003462A37F
MAFVPHTEKDIEQMLAQIGVANVDSLFDEVPANLRSAPLQNIPDAISEMRLMREANEKAAENKSLTCFLGAGAYDHHIPAAVWDITSRGEFLTAYTPYQAEASQGSLQLLYEFQTMIAELTGMDVANASLYDGATALAESVLMAVRINKHSQSKKVLVPESLHPHYMETLECIVRNQHIEIVTLPFNAKTGIVDPQSLVAYQQDDITALVIPQPNFFGCLEDVNALTNWAQAHQVISIACVNPVSLALLAPPGEWGNHGVDIVCGEGQPLGVPLALGGPYFGFFSTRLSHVRQMPGRIVGKTLDKDGKPGFTLTLQAREQHIRRGKATSNICTNQGLLVTAATIHMSLLGFEGLASVAKNCHLNAVKLADKLNQIDGVEMVFSSPFFHEVVLKLAKPVADVLTKLEQAGINGGLELSRYFNSLSSHLLVCVTEMRSEEDINDYYQALQRIMAEG